MIRRAIFVGMLVFVVCMVSGLVHSFVSGGKKKAYSAVSHEVLINGYPYHGRALFLKEDEEYFPLSELASNLGVDDFERKRKSITWDGEDRPYEKDDVLLRMNWGGPSEDFIKVSSIEEVLGLSVVMGEDGVCSISSYPSMKYEWAKVNPWIALNMGGMDSYPSTNSREAFDRHFKQGMRVFLAPISLTSDNVPVAVRSWEEFRAICGAESNASDENDSEEEGDEAAEDTEETAAAEGALDEETFLASKIYSEYTPLTYADLFGLLVKNTDMFLVVDAGELDAAAIQKTFGRLLEEVEHFDTAILGRIIPMASTKEACDAILGLREWDSLIFSLGVQSIRTSTKELVRYAVEKGIRCFSIEAGAADDYLIDALHQMGATVYWNACDDASEATVLRENKGVDGFFTNFVSPKKAQ